MDDVPSTHRFLDDEYVRRWAEEAARSTPERPLVFDAFVDELGADCEGASVLELGSGPGHLAERLLDRCDVGAYWLLDFSRPMHALARERLAGDAGRTHFVEADIRDPDWTANVPDGLDAVVSLQAVHELRHRARAPALYEQVRSRLRSGGVVLVCDHLRPDDDARPLFMSVEEHVAAMRAGGLADVHVAFGTGDLALFRGWRDASGRP